MSSIINCEPEKSVINMNKDDQNNIPNEIYKALRKDPKNMSLEELEEILSKNRGKNTRNKEKDENNNSFYSQRNNSVTETSKVFNKINEKLDKLKVDPVNSSFSPLNIFHKNLQNESINYSNNVSSSMQHIKVLSPKETNFSGYISDTQDRNFNYNFHTGEGDISIKSNNPSVGIYTIKLAASNALKALQDKIKHFQIENEELRKRLIIEEDRIEKEREEFQTKFIKEVNKTRDIESSYRNELESFKEENILLNNVVNEQKNEINLLKTNIQILESEKDRHLEQNIMDKESLKQKIDNIIKEYESSKNKFAQTNKENVKLKEKINQNSEEIKNYERNIEKLQEEIITLKKKTKAHIKSYQTQIDEIKTVYENEKKDLNQKIKELKGKNKEQEVLIKDFEKKTKETKNDIKSIDWANRQQKKPKTSSAFQIKSVPKIKKTLDTGKVSKSRSKSKSKEVKTSNISNININKKIVKNLKTKKFGKSPNKYKNIPTDKSHDNKRNISSNSNYLEDDYLQDIENHKKDSRIGKENEFKNTYDLIHRNTNEVIHNNNPIEIEESSNTLNHINDTIFGLERNIAELNRNYKNLLIKINVSSSIEEQQTLKRNANLIANSLHDQSEKLVNLKAKQQELLKNSLNL